MVALRRGPAGGINSARGLLADSVVTPELLRRRLADLARGVRLLVRPLVTRLETRDCALQVLASSTSAAANYRAATRARSHVEFTAKIGVALEEADETLFWLEHLRDCEVIDASSQAVLDEARQLVAILTAARSTARARQRTLARSVAGGDRTSHWR